MLAKALYTNTFYTTQCGSTKYRSHLKILLVFVNLYYFVIAFYTSQLKKKQFYIDFQKFPIHLVRGVRGDFMVISLKIIKIEF